MKGFEIEDMCFLFCYCKYSIGEVTVCLEIFFITIGLELLLFVIIGYIKGIISFCYNLDVINIIIWIKRFVCLLLDVWILKVVWCNKSIFLDFEDVNIVVYKYC